MDGSALHQAGKRVFQVFEDLLNSCSGTLQTHLAKEEQRFRLWAHSLGLHHQGHSSLDYRVRDAVLVKSQLLRLLGALHDHLENTLAIVKGDRLPYEQQAQDSESQRSSDSDSSRSSNQSAAVSVSSDESTHELDFRQIGVAETINALYGLAARIRSPRNRPERPTQELFRHIAPHEREQYIKERAEIEIAILVYRHRQYLVQAFQRPQNSTITHDILDKYASGSNYLLRRTGVANVRRRQQFIYWKEHAARISRDPLQSAKPTGSEQPTASESFLRAGKTPGINSHLAVPSATSRHEHSEATSATRLDESKFRFEDIQSVSSYQSHAVTTASHQSPLLLQWPPPPENLLNDGYFTCPYCHVICPGRYLVEKAWKAHLIHDLRPYQCTYEHCQDSGRLYGSYQDWIDHENLHTKIWHCDDHQGSIEFERREDYIAHLNQHHPHANQELLSPELMATAFRPSMRPLRMCPLCPTGFEDTRKMREHIKDHLERLTQHCLPIKSFNVDEDDISRGSADSARHVVRDEGSQAFSDTSFRWGNTPDVSSQVVENYIATHSFQDIRQRFCQAQGEHISTGLWLGLVERDDKWISADSQGVFQTDLPWDSDFNVGNDKNPSPTTGKYTPMTEDLQEPRQRSNLAASQRSWTEENINLPGESRRLLNHQLTAAVTKGDFRATQQLLQEGANFDFEDYMSESVLRIASRLGHVAIVQLLLSYGANVNTKHHTSPLQVASAQGHQEIVRLLLENGADVQKEDINYSNPLQAASRHGHSEVVKTLLELGADPNARTGISSHTALHAAVEQGHKNITKLLLEFGADPNASDYYSPVGSVLELAAAKGDQEIVQLLLDHGADLDLKSKMYGGALETAVKHGNQEIQRLLVRRTVASHMKSPKYAKVVEAANLESLKLASEILGAAAIGDANFGTTTAVDENQEGTGNIKEETFRLVPTNEESSEMSFTSQDVDLPREIAADSQQDPPIQSGTGNNDAITTEDQHPYKCRTCGKWFGRECDLKKHTKDHEEPCKCPVEGCSTIMAESKDLDRHLWSRHPDYARGNNMPDNKNSMECGWPGCSYRGRLANLKRHKDNKQHWEHPGDGEVDMAIKPMADSKPDPISPPEVGKNDTPASEALQSHRCPIEGCTASKSEEKDINRHIWTYHPEYAQENSISDTDRVECGWPGCWWRGRRDNLRRHKDSMGHWEPSDSELVSEEKPSGVQACDWPGCQYSYSGKKKSNLKRHKDRHQHWIQPSNDNLAKERPLDSSPTVAAKPQASQKERLEEPTENRGSSNDSTAHVIHDKADQPQIISSGNKSAEKVDEPPGNNQQGSELLKERDIDPHQLFTRPDPKALSEESHETLHSPSGESPSVEEIEADVKRLQDDLGAEHPETLRRMSDLALWYAVYRHFEAAVTLQEKVYEKQKKLYSEEHLDTLNSLTNLAEIYGREARLEESEVLRKKVLEIKSRVFGEEHPETTASMVELASTYEIQGRIDESESLQLQILEIRKRTLGEGHPHTLESMMALGSFYDLHWRREECESLMLRVCELKEQTLGEDHPDTIVAISHLASTYCSEGRFDEAEKLQIQILERSKRIWGEEDHHTASAKAELALTYRNQGRFKEAEMLYVEAGAVQQKTLGKDHPNTMVSRAQLAAVYCCQGRFGEAEGLQVEVLMLRKKILGEEHPMTLVSMGELVETWRAMSRLEEAEALRLDLLRLRKNILGEKPPNTLGSEKEQAQAFEILDRLAEAKPLQIQLLRSHAECVCVCVTFISPARLAGRENTTQW
ncbi:hypothetical protein QBC41DRAFT_275778 [Cercophora samala]|uniref:C2H2-type domain-containing protein n=1 Tax=Cercophora samala TaxID=330535 RepID=A0AA39ZDE1_9PEZI|nr:hypothetical protein QBC41DRAFT_275778 [Cercophora samala]